MTSATQRSIFRWIHILFGIPILGYIYNPFEKLPGYAPPTRYVFLPGMVLTGLWMWKGHVVETTHLEGIRSTERCREPLARVHTLLPGLGRRDPRRRRCGWTAVPVRRGKPNGF